MVGKATNLTWVKLDDDKFYSAIINVKVDGKALPRETTDCIACDRQTSLRPTSVLLYKWELFGHGQK